MSDTKAIWRLATARRRLNQIDLYLRVVGSGYATVDLDRTEQEALATGAAREVRLAPDDILLGARCRILVDERRVKTVLLEPSTEGRLAASLARYGQGPVVAYIAPIPRDADVVSAAATAGIPLSAPANGPLGLARLVLGGPPWGPHLILLDLAPSGDPTPRAATIEP